MTKPTFTSALRTALAELVTIIAYLNLLIDSVDWGTSLASSMITNKYGAYNFNECIIGPQVMSELDADGSRAKIFEVLEKEFTCATICNDSDFFTFSNITT